MKVRQIKRYANARNLLSAKANTAIAKSIKKATATAFYEGIRNFDSVAMVEAVTKAMPDKLNKQDHDLLMLGLHMHVTAEKNAALDAMEDSKLTNKVPFYLELAKSIGFEEALVLPYKRKPIFNTSRHWISENLYVLAHRAYGIVLCFDTYSYEDSSSTEDPSVNACHFYYCWKSNNKLSGATGSGGWESESDPEWRRHRKPGEFPDDMIWVGYNDGREALRYNINCLLQAGTFLPIWPRNTGSKNVRLMSSQDWDDVTAAGGFMSGIADKRTKERMALLPDWVQAIINYSPEEETQCSPTTRP